MYRRIILSLLFLYCFESIIGQTRIDSLIKRANASADDTSKVNLLINLASDLYFEKRKDTTNFNNGLKFADQALRLSEKLKFSKGKAYALLQVGNAYFKTENNVKAFEYFQIALKLGEQLNLSEVIAGAANKIGYIHCFVMNNPAKSKPYFEKALAIHKQSGNKKAYARTLVNLADVYLFLNEDERSLDAEMEAYKISSEIHDSSAIAQITGNIGDHYIKSKQFDKAFKYVTLSRKLQEIRGSKMGVHYNDGRLGNIYFQMGDYKNAESYLLRAYDYASAANYQELLLSTSKLLFDLYMKLGKAEKASKYQTMYYMVKDSINNLEKLAKISEMETDRALEKLDLENEKQLEIAHVKNEQERKQQNTIIASVVFCLILVLIFSVIIFKRFQLSKKQNAIIKLQKEEVELKNEVIEEKQKEILDSIHYAKRIQSALLAHKDFIDAHLENNFVLFKPKDIVSGDFYWAAAKNDKFYLASCDSTGHGVPGAFMSLLNIGFLGEAIKEKNILEPHNIFNYVRERLIDSISKEGQKDGFDGILICVDKANKKVTYAAANNAPVVVREGKLMELECDRMPVGKGELDKSFTLYTFDFKPSDLFYLYTDGYPDQFGGPKGKKFLYKRFNQLLLSLSSKPLDQQSNLMLEEFNVWKGDLEQIDDVCVIGVRF